MIRPLVISPVPDIGRLIVTPRDSTTEVAVGSVVEFDYEFVPQTTDVNGDPIAFVPEPNEVPDLYESAEPTDRVRQLVQRFAHQYAVYPISEEAKLGYPRKELVSLGGEQATIEVAGQQVLKYANNELKFMYYKLPNPLLDPLGADITPQPEIAATVKVYRTNFWSAKKGRNANQFYLSQRGLQGIGDSNNVLEVRINEDAIAGILSLYEPNTLNISVTTDQIFDFSRLAGSTYIERQGYPGDFEIADVGAQQFLFINQFRDEAYWSTDETLYAIDARVLDDSDSLVATPYRWQAANFSQSAFQLASTANGYLGACSFYGDSLILFDINRTTGLDANAQPRIIN